MRGRTGSRPSGRCGAARARHSSQTAAAAKPLCRPASAGCAEMPHGRAAGTAAGTAAEGGRRRLRAKPGGRAAATGAEAWRALDGARPLARPAGSVGRRARAHTSQRTPSSGEVGRGSSGLTRRIQLVCPASGFEAQGRQSAVLAVPRAAPFQRALPLIGGLPSRCCTVSVFSDQLVSTWQGRAAGRGPSAAHHHWQKLHQGRWRPTTHVA